MGISKLFREEKMNAELIECLGIFSFLIVGFLFGRMSQLGRIWAQKEEILALQDVNASQEEDILYLRRELFESFEESNCWFNLAVWLGKALHARSDE